MSTNVALSLPLHFSPPPKPPRPGPSVPKDWRRRWHRTDHPRPSRRHRSNRDGYDDADDCDEILEDDEIQRWVTYLVSWTDQNETQSASLSESLRISIADENGEDIPLNAGIDGKPPELSSRGTGATHIALGLQNGTIWLFKERRASPNVHSGAAQSPALSPTHPTAMERLKSPSHSSIANTLQTVEMEGLSSPTAPTSVMSDVNALGSAARNSSVADVEERLETQWHAGRENHSVVGGVMEALGLHQSEKHHGHPHTHSHPHTHTQNSSEAPSGTSTPASPPYRRRPMSVRKNSHSSLHTSPSSVSLASRPRKSSTATLMDQWDKDSSGVDSESLHKLRLSSLIGSPMQHKTSKAVHEEMHDASLPRPVISTETKEEESLQQIEAVVALQSPSCSPIVSLLRINPDRLVSLQEDGSLSFWCLRRLTHLATVNVKTSTVPVSEASLSAALNSSTHAASSLSALVALRSHTASPVLARSRSSSNATQPTKTVLDSVPQPGVSKFKSMQIVEGSLTVKYTILAACHLNDCSAIAPVARMSADAEEVEVLYVTSKHSIQLHSLRIARPKVEEHAAEPVKQHHLSSAAAFLRREGYSNVPSRVPSIAEEKAETFDLGNGGLKENLDGLRMLRRDLLLGSTKFGLHLFKMIADSLVLLHSLECPPLQDVSVRNDFITAISVDEVVVVLLKDDSKLERLPSFPQKGMIQAQTISSEAEAGVLCCTMDETAGLQIVYNNRQIWQGADPSQPATTISAALPYSMERIVLSLSTGHLIISSLAELVAGKILEPPTDSRPHKGTVHLLRLVINPRTQNKHVVGGTEEGDIIFWDAATLRMQSQRSLLTCPIVDMVVLGKDDNTLRLNGCLVCIGADGSIVVFLLDGLTDLYTIPGRGVPLEELAVRTDELLLIYEDARARVWDMKTSELRRSVGLDQAMSLLDDGKGWWSRHTLGPSQMKIERGSAGVLSSVPTSRDMTAGTMNANLRRAIEAASRMVSSSNGRQAVVARGNTVDAEDMMQDPPATEDKVLAIPAASLRQPSGKKAAQTLRPLFQALMPLGLDDDIDELARMILDAADLRPTSWIQSGTCSSLNYLAISSSVASSSDLLSLSPVMTTTRMLCLMSMLLVMSSIAEIKAPSLDLLVLLGEIPALVGASYQQPCLAALADYVTDSVTEIRQAAQTLFVTTLDAMMQEDVERLCDEWSGRLPARNAGGDQADKAVILLGLVATERYTILPPVLLKDIAKSVALYLEDESEPAKQMTAIFLCDRGFTIFQHYFDAMNVMRTLFSLSTNKTQDPKEEVSAATLEARSLARRATLRISEENTPLFMTTLSMDILHAQSPAHCNATMRLVALMVRKKPLILHPNLPRLAEAVVKSLDPTITSMRTVIHRSATIIISELVATYPTIAFHKELQRLAVGTFEGAIIMYDLKTSTRLYVIEAHQSSLSGLSFSQDGRRLVSICLNDGKVKVWKTGVGFGAFLNFGGAPRQGNLLSAAAMAPSKSATDAADKVTTMQSSTGHAGTNAYKSFEFGRVIEGDGDSAQEADRLDLISFEWVASRSVKLRVGVTSMAFDVA